MGGDEGPAGGNAKFGEHKRNKIIERMTSKDGKKKDEKKKDEEEVEEPIESREGYRWVEICASFPHSQQIVEYVKALRERAKDVKLEYAMVDVERQELTPNFTWSEFKPIPIKEQFDYVSSAISMEAEGSRALVPGLAMNVPMMDVQQREYLHLDKDKFPFYEKPEQATYTLDELDPLGAEARREREAREWKMRNPGKEKKKETKKDDAEKKYLPDRGGGQDLGFNDPSKRKDDKNAKSNNRVALKTALVRYWDFTVEPGRRYKYRIRVRVFNPNYKRTDVADTEMASRLLLTGPWSETSDEVFVNFDNHWYVAEQKRSSQKSNEMMLEVHYWYRGMGEWLGSTFAQRVGQVVGLADRAKPLKVLDWNDVSHEYEPRDLKMERFDSGNVLVGLSQGNATFDLGPLGSERGVAIPREAVALNPFGDLVRHEEQADKVDDVRVSVNENYSGIAKSIAELTGEGKKEEKEEPKKGGKKGGRGGAAGGGGASGA